MLVSQKIRNLLGGVSQMPITQRASNQVEDLTNAWISRKDGLGPRPGTLNIGALASGINEAQYKAGFYHAAMRDPTTRYFILIVNGALSVFDAITGAAQTVISPLGTSYLTSAPKGFRAMTVGDYTFLVNRNTTVKRGTSTAAVEAYEALLFIRQTDFSIEYSITLDGNTVTFKTVDQASASSRYQVSTNNVAADMMVALQGEAQIAADFSFTQYGSTLYLTRNDGKDFTLTVHDGLADKGIKAIKGVVQYVEDLPERAKAGMVVRVTGQPGTGKDDFWVKYEESSTPTQAGVWRETAAPGTPLNIDAATMPWALIRRGPVFEAGANQPLPPAPKVTRAAATSWTDGFVLDPDTATPYDGDTDLFLTDHDKKLRTGVLSALDGSTRILKTYYDVDTRDLRSGESLEVRLYADTGAGMTLVTTKHYSPGYLLEDESIGSTMALPVGTKVEIRSYYSGKATPPAANLGRVTVHRNSHPRTGAATKHTQAAKRSIVFDTAVFYPTGCQIAVTLDGIVFTHTVGASDESGSAVATALNTLIDAHANYVSTVASGTISVTKSAGTALVVSVAVTRSNTVFWNRSVTMTPSEHVGRVLRNLTDGSTATITANSATSITTGALSGGIDNTLQHGDICQVESSGTYYVFTTVPWAPRGVGDLENDPFPSFVDQEINDVFFFQNRLGFLSGESIIMSGAGDLFRFTRATTTDLLADDPIDITSAHKEVSTFDSAVIWKDQLVISSTGGQQFLLKGDPVLTPTTVRLDHLGSHAVSAIRPVVWGDRLVLVSEAAECVQLNELYYDRDGNLQSNSLTDHIPVYIAGTPKSVVADSASGFLGVITDHVGTMRFYACNSELKDGERLFTAWNEWTFGDNLGVSPGYVVGTSGVVSGKMYLIVVRNSVPKLANLESMDLRLLPDPAAAASLRDRQGGGAVTTWDFSCVLSRIYLRNRETDEVDSVPRVQLRYVTLNNYADSYIVEVAVTGHAAAVNTRPDGTFAQQNDPFRVPVMSHSNDVTITIKNAVSGGSTFRIYSLEWEGYVTRRSRAL